MKRRVTIALPTLVSSSLHLLIPLILLSHSCDSAIPLKATENNLNNDFLLEDSASLRIIPLGVIDRVLLSPSRPLRKRGPALSFTQDLDSLSAIVQHRKQQAAANYLSSLGKRGVTSTSESLFGRVRKSSVPSVLSINQDLASLASLFQTDSSKSRASKANKLLFRLGKRLAGREPRGREKDQRREQDWEQENAWNRGNGSQVFGAASIGQLLGRQLESYQRLSSRNSFPSTKRILLSGFPWKSYWKSYEGQGKIDDKSKAFDGSDYDDFVIT